MKSTSITSRTKTGMTGSASPSVSPKIFLQFSQIFLQSVPLPLQQVAVSALGTAVVENPNCLLVVDIISAGAGLAKGQ